MKRWLIWIAPVAGLAAGLAAGWLLGVRAVAPGARHVPPLSPTSGAATGSAAGAPAVAGAESRPSAASAAPQPASLAEVLRQPSDFHRLGAMARLLGGLASPHECAALYEQFAGKLSYENHELLNLLFRHWATVAPADAVRAALAGRETRPMYFQGPLYMAVMALAARDPAAALAAIAPLRNVLVQTLRAQVRALELPKPGQLLPAEALERFRLFETSTPAEEAEMSGALNVLAKDWAAHDFETAWQAVNALPEGPRTTELRQQVLAELVRSRAVAETDRLRAFIEALPPGPTRDHLRLNLLEALAEGGKFGQASGYALSLPPGKDRVYAVGKVGLAALKSEGQVDAAFGLLNALSPEEWKGSLRSLHYLLRELSLRDSSRTLAVLEQQWAAGRSSEDFPYVVADLAHDLRGRDSAGAANALARLPLGGFGLALESAVFGWAQRDAGAAAAWLADLPAGEAQTRAAGKLAEGWSLVDGTRAAEWINSLPPSDAKWAATGALAAKTISISPETALTWIRAVPDEARRMSALHRAWLGWSWIDRAAADAWRDRAPQLTPAERAVLRR